MFDEAYQPIPGTNPQQLRSRFTDFTDATLPAIQEALLEADARVVFCATVDRNGYLPTHNRKFSKPQRQRCGLEHGERPQPPNLQRPRRSGSRRAIRGPFLLQTYRRDMGGGQYCLMKDASAPITVLGRHWGGLRLAYTASIS